ncbi:hypothetical protein EYF80_019192 [Liparis tanakae]|uniref:Uncharacterized protein n=1 Tax=Liparis tanakae TaxID=230148 RepID=A0A4Z2HY72_9TELE|nr:hypothetical protein EYF80_019192 [Liparis tanakae]
MSEEAKEKAGSGKAAHRKKKGKKPGGRTWAALLFVLDGKTLVRLEDWGNKPFCDRAFKEKCHRNASPKATSPEPGGTVAVGKGVERDEYSTADGMSSGPGQPTVFPDDEDELPSLCLFPSQTLTSSVWVSRRHAVAAAEVKEANEIDAVIGLVAPVGDAPSRYTDSPQMRD